MTLGARRDWAEQKLDNRLTGARTEQRDAANSFRGALMYRSDIGLAPYFSYSESFQPNIGSDRNGNQFSPSRGKQYEVGMKLSLIHISIWKVCVFRPVGASPA